MLELTLAGRQSADWSSEDFVVDSSKEAKYADIYITLPIYCSVCGKPTPDYVWVAGSKTFCREHAPLLKNREVD